jgi:hypothetical protein
MGHPYRLSLMHMNARGDERIASLFIHAFTAIRAV